MRNVIVIGAGLSGLMGALALADADQRPFVLAKGQGATHWLSGTIDIWGTPGTTSPTAALETVFTDQPEHPYTLAGKAGIDAAISRFRTLVAAARYPYVGTLERNVMLPTALGALRPAALFPATMAAGDARLGGDLLIAGFRELRDFFPPLAAANLTAQGHPARGIYLDMPAAINRRLDFSPRSLAELFEQPGFCDAIGKQLRAQRGNATRIGMPAVLGLHNPLSVINELQHLSGAQIFEIPTIPPSVPGMRLFEIFRAAIVHAGGRFQLGSYVLRATGNNGHLETVYSEAAAREQEHRARAFLLATGGVAGGGITTDHTGTVRETALGLPLQAPTNRNDWFAARFLAETGHPIFQAGVPVNRQFQPLGPDGNLVYQNVAAAGTTLAHTDPVRERSYSGMTLTSGWAAGQQLAAFLKQ
jgi:glycerol-3-phosphate dehydrogenase subunit B